MIKRSLKSFWLPVQKKWREGKKEKTRKAIAKLFVLNTNTKIKSILHHFKSSFANHFTQNYLVPNMQKMPTQSQQQHPSRFYLLQIKKVAKFAKTLDGNRASLSDNIYFLK